MYHIGEFLLPGWGLLVGSRSDLYKRHSRSEDTLVLSCPTLSQLHTDDLKTLWELVDSIVAEAGDEVIVIEQRITIANTMGSAYSGGHGGGHPARVTSITSGGTEVPGW